MNVPADMRSTPAMMRRDMLIQSCLKYLRADSRQVAGAPDFAKNFIALSEGETQYIALVQKPFGETDGNVCTRQLIGVEPAYLNPRTAGLAPKTTKYLVSKGWLTVSATDGSLRFTGAILNPMKLAANAAFEYAYSVREAGAMSLFSMGLTQRSLHEFFLPNRTVRGMGAPAPCRYINTWEDLWGEYAGVSELPGIPFPTNSQDVPGYKIACDIYRGGKYLQMKDDGSAAAKATDAFKAGCREKGYPAPGDRAATITWLTAQTGNAVVAGYVYDGHTSLGSRRPFSVVRAEVEAAWNKAVMSKV